MRDEQKMQNAEKFEAETYSIILSWLMHCSDPRGKLKSEFVANKIGIKQRDVNALLRPNETTYARLKIAKPNILSWLSGLEYVPGNIHLLVCTVYPEWSSKSNKDIPILSQRTLSKIPSLHYPNEHSIYGINLILRRSSQAATSGVDGAEYSLSLLNNISREFQDGYHSGLFKIHQRSRDSQSNKNIEGIIYSNSSGSEIFLEGSSVVEKTPYLANIRYDPEIRESFINGSGSLKGLVTGSSAFYYSSRICVFHIMHEKGDFIERFRSIKEFVNVHKFEDVVRIFKTIGVSCGEDEWSYLNSDRSIFHLN